MISYKTNPINGMEFSCTFSVLGRVGPLAAKNLASTELSDHLI